MSDVNINQDEMVQVTQVLDDKKPRRHGDLKPCDRCRAQHLKCVYEGDKCQRCVKSGHECVRNRKNIRFRDVSAAKFHTHMKKLSHPVVNKPLQFVGDFGDQEPAAIPRSTSAPSTETATHTPTEPDVSEYGMEQADHTSNGYDIFGHDVHEHDVQNILTTDAGQFQVPLPVTMRSPTDVHALSRVFSSDRASTVSSHASSQRMVPRTIPRYLDSLVKSPSNTPPENSQPYLENVLLRYFHEELAPWFDLCDPDRHFATVVPQKAREPGPLRSALLTISARNLARNKRFRNAAGIVQWNDILMPELKDEFAVPYHNECIHDLLHLSMDPRKLYDETLLAAVVALRTDEEMDTSMQSELEDQQLFLRIASVFIQAQVPPKIVLPHSSPEVFHPETRTEEPLFQSSPAASMASSAHRLSAAADDLGANGLRQACFWTAFRQELHAAFLKQQPVRFPLSRCDAFRQLTPAIDAVWANRMVTFCADVLEFCYGSESSDGKVLPAYTSQERWSELRDYERRLCLLLPSSFEPTYCCEPNIARGDVFPEIWFLDPCHVCGTTYVELARMLLEVFNPTRPKLGHGFIAATTAFLSSTKKILFRLCGIAVSNRHCPPSLINACLAISVLGEYFEEPDEQDALLGILALMADRHAYPMHRIASSLKRAWNREDAIVFDESASVVSINHMDTG